MILRAARFAKEAHEGQVRKYSGLPYIIHPARVAGRAALLAGASEAIVAAAYLHDAVEDTDVTFEQVEALFGGEVGSLVFELTTPRDLKGNRAERKRQQRELLSVVSSTAKEIKMLDRIDNLGDLARDDSGDFARVYAKESMLLLSVIGDANRVLADELMRAIDALESRERTDP